MSEFESCTKLVYAAVAAFNLSVTAAAGGGGEVGDLQVLCSFTKDLKFAHL